MVAINIIMAIVIVAMVGQHSIADASLAGFAVIGGLSLAYRNNGSTWEQRSQMLAWIAFVQIVFVALSGI